MPLSGSKPSRPSSTRKSAKHLASFIRAASVRFRSSLIFYSRTCQDSVSSPNGPVRLTAVAIKRQIVRKAPKLTDISVALLIVQNGLRCGSVQFNLCAHFLQTNSKHFDLLHYV